MGTAWQIEVTECPPAALREAEEFVRDIEDRCSRFQPDSQLSRLNRERRIDDPVIAELTSLALEFRSVTHGAFDPAVGDAVVASGYDRSFELIRGAPALAPRLSLGQPAIPVHGDTVELRGPGRLDLGGIAKGWTVDHIGALLEQRGARTYFVDGGGDLLVGGERETDEVIELCTGGYRIGLRRGGVASSSTVHRHWETPTGSAHHIIDPRTDLPADGQWVQASVVAANTTTADVLATALLADAESTLPALPRQGAEALLVSCRGDCMMTPGLAAYLL